MRIPTGAILLAAWAALPASAQFEITAQLPGEATMRFVWIRPGTFRMGSPDSESGRYDDEGPQHVVTLTRGYWLAKHELTQGQWQAVMGTHPWRDMSYVHEHPDYPAVGISWEDVQRLIERLNVSPEGGSYRLPTEAEWEYACRAGTTTRWSCGEDSIELHDYAWYSENDARAELRYARPVGTKLANPWGVHDMHGNVWEWVQDWWHLYWGAAQVDPPGPPSGVYRVARGGTFFSTARLARSATRYLQTPDRRHSLIGARLCREALETDPVPTSLRASSWGEARKATASR